MERVNEALLLHQRKELQKFWKNSSLRSASVNVCQLIEEKISDFMVQGTDGQTRRRDKSKLGFDSFAQDGHKASKETSNDIESKTANQSNHSQPVSLFSQRTSNVLGFRRSFYTFHVHSQVPNRMNKVLYSTKSSGRGSGRQAKPIATKFKGELNEQAKESKVPGTRIGRLISFGSLGAGLALGTLSDVARRSMGAITQDASGAAVAILDKSPFLSEANAERIVNTLCRVRGAALKLGQMLSIQDNSLINPDLQKVFERVRQSADFMPVWQMERVMSEQLGRDWKNKFAEFDLKPFAAASIGQVHRGCLHDGRQVAVKIQYPGVANSINSDIDNLMTLLKVWNVLPEGLYAKNALTVAKRELTWECDYLREAKCGQKFREFFEDDLVFYIPEVIWDLTTSQVLTTELVQGEPLDKLFGGDQETKNWVCENIIRLCLNEVFIFNFMQTDPNWSNFLYDKESGKITLLDFGASREYSRKFTDVYIEVIKAASDGDRDGVLEGSRKLGFLTGFESKIMEKAHVDAVMILGEPFSKDESFDFGKQSTAARIHGLIPVMLKHRLTPPPEETYSLHRKMSGCFLLCAKLDACINCKPMFDEIWEKYRQRKNS